MNISEISLTPLKNALEQLKIALLEPKSDIVRDAVIQRFEFTFELCWRTIQRFLVADHPLTDTSTRNVLRESHTYGLISAVEPWFEFQKYRNMTSHIYSKEVAEEIFDKIKLFPPLCQALINTLEKKKQK